MGQQYEGLGSFSDMVDRAREAAGNGGGIEPGPETVRTVLDTLGFADLPEVPIEPRIENTWTDGDLHCETISWSVGYGPRTEAFLFLPKEARPPLPGVIALHCHSGYKYYGKEKIAAGPTALDSDMGKVFDHYYGGRPYANALARKGFAVLVPDVFTWGSRRVPLETIGRGILDMVDDTEDSWAGRMQAERGMTHEVARYTTAANHHEATVEKYCNLLGTTFAGVISHEDRIAVNYLMSRREVSSEGIGSLGLSGGGGRSGLLQATCEHIKAAVVVGMMSTYDELLDHNVSTHTYMIFPAGWARHGDWPDLVAARAPSPLMVQYDLEDGLFPEQGMRKADKRLGYLYGSVGAGENYTGQFYPGPHKFDLEMQESAFSWLGKRLGRE